MKKATGANKTKSVTLDKIRTRKPTKRQRDEIAALAALPDDRIDLSDIPEITATSGWVRNPLYQPLTRSITIRLNGPISRWPRLFQSRRGLPYQTYIKQLLHNALERELSAARR